jgi:type II secretory ATPase GspE/PulE/Tfp pilus assembly ATPase PilB-like protein
MSQDARVDEERATQRRAQLLNLDYFDTSTMTEKPLYKDVLEISEIKQLRIIPVSVTKGNILFGITTTTSQQTMRQLQQRFADNRVSFAIISETGFYDYVNLYDPPKQIIYHDIELNSAGTDDLIQQVSATLEQVRADDMLAYIVHQAHKLGASDIHIENQKEFVRIRFRIDGVLHAIARVSQDKSRILLAAIASGANVSTSADEAQQGHIAQHVQMADGGEVDVNLRVETVPTINGMDVVMRLFNMHQEMYQLDRLGLSENERKIVDDIIAKPSGLVMIVGPTGSGKTTTLYSMLNSLNNEERKIITIEDPVEYQFEGITQITVKSQSANDQSFAERLRAVLRLDPDIVMVGEIRDMETAKTALQASLTGHLVLSTFHASSAAAALTRLMDIIGENPLFISAVRLVMAQRLVRKLDDDIKQEHQPTEAERAQLQRIIDTLPEGVERPNLDHVTLYKPGTSEENPYGYRGQIALREQFLMSEDIIKTLQNVAQAGSTQDIENAAIHSGMLTMLQNGALAVCRGETTIEEVTRVIG